MDHFIYRNGQLCVEGVSLQDVASQVGTPCYVYSRAAIEQQWRAYDQSLSSREHSVCYAVKANSNIGLLNVLARLGAGFDIVSGGELFRVLQAGGDRRKVVFSGVGKTEAEMRYALSEDIACFNVESVPELERLSRVAAEMDKRARIALRVNPDVDAKTHPYISTGLKENKFGIDINNALAVYERAAQLKSIEIVGVACHIGSQLTSLSPFLDALDRVLALVAQLATRGIALKHLDLGGGLGIRYRHEEPPVPSDYAKAVLPKLAGLDVSLHIEPGRSIVGNAGVLLTQVEYLKDTPGKNFAVVDAAMNDLLRPALYGAWQEIVPVNAQSGEAERVYDVVGPVCETGDFLGKDRSLRLSSGDLLAVMSAGAYGFSMSSNYNTRPRAAEVMVDGDAFHVIRRRESWDDLVRGEARLPG